jgi:hypothetical protein
MDGPHVMRLDALQSYREAKQAVPRSQWPILEHVVIRNASVSSYGAEHRMRRDKAVGYLISRRSTAWSITTAYGTSSKRGKPHDRVARPTRASASTTHLRSSARSKAWQT